MTRTIRVFVTYSRQDSQYIGDRSLLDFLRGLESEGVEFWVDQQRLQGSDLWEPKLLREVDTADVALALVSQAFLDSKFCQEIEIPRFLERGTPIFPVILSPCESHRHKWLQERQYLPAGEETIEEQYLEEGKRKRLFIQIRGQLRDLVEAQRQVLRPAASEAEENPFSYTREIREPARFVGRERELRDLQARLKGGSVLLWGGAKMGKSSLLWQMADRWQGKVLGPFDFQSFEDPADFYGCLADQLECDGKWPKIRQALQAEACLLLLDELDAGPTIGFDHSHLARFRALASKGDLHLLGSSRRLLKDVFQGAGSEAFNVLMPVEIRSMPRPEIEILLRHPWQPSGRQFEEGIRRQLVDLAAGHPFRAQRAAFHCFQDLLDPGADWLADFRSEMEHLL